MKICTQCGKHNFDSSKFCDTCGATLQQANVGASQPQILARSESNRSKLDADYQSKYKEIRLLSIMGSIAGVIPVFWPFLEALFEDKSVKYASSAPGWAWFICIVLFVICLIIVISHSKAIKETYEYYCSLEACEQLIVDTNKIYGKCEKGSISLPYSNIKQVSVYSVPETRVVKDWNFANPRLQIIDNRGNRYVFGTFRNANELKEIILNQKNMIH